MIVLTGGKTGGHIVPLLAVAKEVNEDILYVGGKDFLEEKLAGKENIKFLGLDFNQNKISLYFKLRKLIKIRPKYIISSGGFVSIPMLLFGIFNRVPIYLLEENVIMGSANKLFSLFSKRVFLSYPLKKMKKKYLVVGQPILKRKLDFIEYHNYNFDILIIGGSLGAKPLCDIANFVSEKYKVALVAGKYKDKYVNDNYYTFGYVDNLLNLMIHSKLIISRAGAATTSEIFSLNKPCILVPSMKTKKNHQYLNALYFEKIGCCKVVLEKNINEINNVIDKILSNEIVIKDMKKNQNKIVNLDSANNIIKEIENDF